MCCLILAEVICQGAAAALCTWDWALRLAQEPNEVLMDTCILNCMTCGDWAKVKFCEANHQNHQEPVPIPIWLVVWNMFDVQRNFWN